MAKSRNQPAHRNPEIERRSPCPVSCALDLLGDRWTLLVIRDLFLGRGRFRDFVASPEGIPTNILAERLERLLQAGLIEQVPTEEGAKRMAYRLTEKGRDLGPILKALRDWGLRWEKGTKALMVVESATIHEPRPEEPSSSAETPSTTLSWSPEND